MSNTSLAQGLGLPVPSTTADKGGALDLGHLLLGVARCRYELAS